jgi:hypothetical protein
MFVLTVIGIHSNIYIYIYSRENPPQKKEWESKEAKEDGETKNNEPN